MGNEGEGRKRDRVWKGNREKIKTKIEKGTAISIASVFVEGKYRRVEKGRECGRKIDK
jgi:hypothetical protein